MCFLLGPGAEPRLWSTDYMAHLVEVQHERGASGGQTFHSLLTASLPPRRGTTCPCSEQPSSRVVLATGRCSSPLLKTLP